MNKNILSLVLFLILLLGTSNIVVSGATLEYTSPSCGPWGGSTEWACGAWPSVVAPVLGPAGTVTEDPDTRNRVLRLTQSGSLGETSSTAFKAFDAGWRRAWNANSSRIIVVPWSTGTVRHTLYWVGFDATTMSLTGVSAPIEGFVDAQWDQYDPDLVVGLSNGKAKSYNIQTMKWTTIFDPLDVNWGGNNPWVSAWGGNTVCIAGGGQDIGIRVACHNIKSGTSQVINLRTQTINGAPFAVYFQDRPVLLPSSATIHTITLGIDGRWLAIDTHGNSLCSMPGLTNYSSTGLFVDLETSIGYEWNNACGDTHWAYGQDGVMVQSTSPKWTATGANGPCNSDSRGLVHRKTDNTIDSSLYQTAPCSFYSPATWSINVHLSWANNTVDSNANSYPVLLATASAGIPNSFLWNDIAAMQTSAPPYQGTLWRFAQTWNDPAGRQCSFLDYSSPSISPDGKWAVFPSDWRGQTGSNGICTNGRRTDLFVFELK